MIRRAVCPLALRQRRVTFREGEGCVLLGVNIDVHCQLRRSSSRSSSAAASGGVGEGAKFPSSPYDRDAIDQFEGFAPENAFCGRLATVAKQPIPSGCGPGGDGNSSSYDSSSGAYRYLVEQGTLLGRLCAVGNAIEQDLKRIHYDLFDRRQLRFVGTGSAAAKKEANSVDQRVVENGSAAVVMKPVKKLVMTYRTFKNGQKKNGAEEDALALPADSPDRHVPFFNRYQLNYYYRVNVVPKRHIGNALYVCAWNLLSASTTAAAAIVTIPLHYVYMSPQPTRDMVLPSSAAASRSLFAKVAYTLASSPSKAARGLYGVYRGARAASLYALISCGLAPLVHVSQALCNMPYGIKNALSAPRYTFDACDGVWIPHSDADSCAFQPDLVERMQRMMAVGRREAFARKVASEGKWKEHLSKLGIGRGGAGGTGAKSDDPYEILNVPRDATQQQIKSSYQKLAKIYHPDVSASSSTMSAKEKEASRERFEEVASAYKVLSNPDTRRMYDRGGKRAVDSSQQQGAVLVGSSGDVMERVFGGLYFRETLTGMHFRSHWHMKFQFQCCVSISELEELQSMQMRLVAVKLASILDVHARDKTVGPLIHLGTSNPQAVAETLVANYRNSAAASASPTSAVGAGAPSAANNKAKPNPFLKSTHQKQSSAASPIHKQQTSPSASSAGASNTTDPLSSSSSSSSNASTAAGAKKSEKNRGEERKPLTDPLVLALSTVPPTDAEFSFAFRNRVSKYIQKLSTACFGKEILHELGTSYIVTARSYLGAEGSSFYDPKRLQWKKSFSGCTRVMKQFKVRVADKTKEEMQQLAAVEFFSMEWDNVVCDVHVQARFTAQLAVWSREADEVVADLRSLPLPSSAESVPTTPTGVPCNTLRFKRLRALWYIGQQMIKEGSPWDDTARETDHELIEYFKKSAKGGMDGAPIF